MDFENLLISMKPTRDFFFFFFRSTNRNINEGIVGVDPISSNLLAVQT